MNTISKYYHTLKYLKSIQIYYQLKYRWRKIIGHKSRKVNKAFEAKLLSWDTIIRPVGLWNGDRKFTFLNLSRSYKIDIDWNDSIHGKLWTYNLNYFECLNQSDISKDDGVALMQNYVDSYSAHVDGKEPYPTSLRILNWIKYINQHQILNESIDRTIGIDAYRLLDNLEYHLLANHLLENGFALLFAGVYLQDGSLLEKGSHIVESQLSEQILNDGAHYELSPMYHQLMLHRVLDSIQLLRVSHAEKNLLDFLEKKAIKMLGWLLEVTFRNGDIPLVNDAAKNVNANTAQLVEYANKLKIKSVKTRLADSGYRKIDDGNYELFVDIGNIKPSYQPGHAHADTFSYLIHVDENPFIVEAGTNTYENNRRRKYERSTEAHNSVSVDGNNSSKVWSSFRVAKRAEVNDVSEEDNYISASHNGFVKRHTRLWNCENCKIGIHDKFDVAIRNAISYVHFHPSVKILSNNDNSIVTDRGKIEFDGHSKYLVEDYEYAEEFNEVMSAQVVKVSFNQSLTTNFIF